VTLLESCKNKHDFQTGVMMRFLENLESATTSGITSSGIDGVDSGKAYTYISNHRDIVLDASFINLCFLRKGIKTSEVAIGDNLLIYDWITHLVKLNGSFIVKRNLPTRQALDAAKQLSGYIHHAVTEKCESIWIAQRQGRAKDSSDHTQESVIKMLALGGDKTSLVERLMELNITPTAISYEYDPNDYLKAREFLARRRDPEFKKSQRDDLFSMETGILQFKGCVHFAIGHNLNSQLSEMLGMTDKVEIVRRVCSLIDKEIHSGYHIYPINYIAYDELNKTDRFSSEYTTTDVDKFDEYINRQLDKVDLPDITEEERAFMRQQILIMYSNPLHNKLLATGQES
ncbi:MAG: acyltransferase, partial [Duncaniella sp.]|nr:acyltransferase [Duncaniella sp.]